MPYLADIYVIVNSRSSILVNRLINLFLPGGAEESATLYEVPRFNDPTIITFSNAPDFMRYLEVNQNEPHAIY